MIKIPGSLALLAVAVLLPPPAFSRASARQQDYAAIGRATVSEIAQEQWAAVEARFDQKMRAGLFFLPPPAPAATSGKQPDYTAIGRATVTEIAQRQWSAIEARFDQRMKSALPQSKLSATWRQITTQAGAFQRITGVTLGEESGYHIALVHCAFANTNLDAKVVMDPTGSIAGLFFVPPAS